MKIALACLCLFAGAFVIGCGSSADDEPVSNKPMTTNQTMQDDKMSGNVAKPEDVRSD